MKIAFVTTDWAQNKYRQVTGEMGAVGYYRCYKPAEYLKELGHETQVFGANEMRELVGSNAFEKFHNLVKGFDLVVIKQLDNRHASKLIAACKVQKIPIVMDLDDNFLEIDKDHPAAKTGYGNGGIKKAYATAALSLMDGIFVSTEPLKKYYTNYLKKQFNLDIPTFVLPNCVDDKDWKFETKGNEEKVVISYHGSITHDKDLKVVLPSVYEVMKDNPNVYFLLFGAVRNTSVEDLFGEWDAKTRERLALIEGTPSWVKFPELMCSYKLDIGIAPLEDTEFTRGKSHIKWMEYALRGTPVIASKVYPYYKKIQGTETIIEGQTGYLATTSNEFKRKLLKLIQDKDLRIKVGNNAKEFVVDKWHYRKHIHKWDDAVKHFQKA